ncbi:MAG: bifunctional glutamate N-acetyltransferase/amino-acid acetyltransferase ArgJ [Trueperaceae bacterium]
MKLPRGFSSTAVKAGIKPSGKPDLAILAADGPLAWAFVGTKNRLAAPCVARNRLRYGTGEPVRAVVVNSGNANCASGDQAGFDNDEMASRAASALGGIRPQEVLTASTGVIGVPMPMDKVRKAVPQLPSGLGDESDAMAEAILTTDLKTKQVGATLRSGARIVGVAKGSGMIHPNMATMLAFIATDAHVTQVGLRDIWPAVVQRTFNQVTVDGDTSPNDMAFLLSSGHTSASASEFAEALEAVAAKLAEKIAADGEGASTLIRVQVSGARDEADARSAARAVAGSSLVKTAVHGRDPNWGRILSAVGQTGVLWDASSLRISLQGAVVFEGGAPRTFDADALSQAMDDDAVEIDVDLAAGRSEARAWGCDLTDGYVRINADYTT